MKDYRAQLNKWQSRESSVPVLCYGDIHKSKTLEKMINKIGLEVEKTMAKKIQVDNAMETIRRLKEAYDTKSKSNLIIITHRTIYV